MSAPSAAWIDLLDPDEEGLRHAWGDEVHPHAVDHLLTPTVRRIRYKRPQPERNEGVSGTGNPF